MALDEEFQRGLDKMDGPLPARGEYTVRLMLDTGEFDAAFSALSALGPLGVLPLSVMDSDQLVRLEADPSLIGANELIVRLKPSDCLLRFIAGATS